MTTIVTRAGKGSPLTNTEVDSNFTNLNNDKVEKTGTSPVSVTVNSATTAMRITQTGTGNALVVEDSANPDATPFVIDASGNVGIGTVTTNAKLNVQYTGNTPISGPSSGTWAATIVNQQDSPDFNGLSVQNRWANTNSILFEAAQGWNDSSNAYFPIFTIDGLGQVISKPERTERFRVANTGTISLGAAPGSESLRVTPVASAVNYLSAYGGATGQGPQLRFEGSDTNINGYYDTKGTGAHLFRTNVYGGAPTQFVVAHTASAVNYMLIAGNTTGNGCIFRPEGSDTNIPMNFTSKGSGGVATYTNSYGNLQFNIAHTASAVNYLQVTGGATGNAATLSAQGSDTNIDLALTPKGTGRVRFGTLTATSDVAITGYIEVKDSAGNVRKLAVIS